MQLHVIHSFLLALFIPFIPAFITFITIRSNHISSTKSESIGKRVREIATTFLTHVFNVRKAASSLDLVQRRSLLNLSE